MPPRIPGGAMCVQRFDDSLNSAIHITYRISLRSSSMPEPRDPLLKVLFEALNITQIILVYKRVCWVPAAGTRKRKGRRRRPMKGAGVPPRQQRFNRQRVGGRAPKRPYLSNDPSAGSPTERFLFSSRFPTRTDYILSRDCESPPTSA